VQHKPYSINHITAFDQPDTCSRVWRIGSNRKCSHQTQGGSASEPQVVPALERFELREADASSALTTSVPSRVRFGGGAVACSCPRPDLLLFTVLGAKLTAGVWVAGLGAGESGRSRLARGGSTGLGSGVRWWGREGVTLVEGLGAAHQRLTPLGQSQSQDQGSWIQLGQGIRRRRRCQAWRGRCRARKGCP